MIHELTKKKTHPYWEQILFGDQLLPHPYNTQILPQGFCVQAKKYVDYCVRVIPEFAKMQKAQKEHILYRLYIIFMVVLFSPHSVIQQPTLA